MQTEWHFVDCNCNRTGNGFETLASVAPGASWFDGHFPGYPVLPGIALIAMVFDALQRHVVMGETGLKLKGVKRVRFKRPILPNMPFAISATLKQSGTEVTCVFNITAQNELACSGVLTVDMPS